MSRRLNRNTIRHIVGRTTKRPVEKRLINVSKATVSTQVTSILLTTTNACTISGLRWSLSVGQDGGGGIAFGHWAVVVVKEGNTVNAIGTGDAGTFYAPEQNVLTFGNWLIDNNVETKIFSGNTKTMRKMQGGDVLLFVVVGVATNTSVVFGTFQFFCKT